MSNRLLIGNISHGGGAPYACAKDAAHIYRKVVVRDDAVIASTGLSPDLKAGGLEV
jgi:hypothetical protein